MYSYQKSLTYVCEYVWIGGNGELRSKTRVLQNFNNDLRVPEWNFDGSSTEQAPSDGNTEVILKPVKMYNNPLRILNNNCKSVLVLCDTYNNDDMPIPTNHRHNAVTIFEKVLEHLCWFGIEQEYFISFNNINLICENNKSHYCGSTKNYIDRTIVEEHLRCCIEAGLNISGINAEVATGQWEFQIGPSKDYDAADEVIVARYLLERIAEKYGAIIDYSPKISDSANGSGCHINFSTEKMRLEGGFEEILSSIKKLEKKHSAHIAVYGENNHLRLTGLHETSSMDIFSWGIGTRNTSIRIPNATQKNKCGYFEDRRPAANIDPYLTTSIIAETCCLDSL